MLTIQCSGTPYEVGLQHGRAAKNQVRGSIAFYEGFFMKKSNMSWPTVCQAASDFVPYLAESWPAYVEEMEGLAKGAGVDFKSIVALNVRTEIAYGMASDGCTAFCWKTDVASFLAQNWDWDNEQAPNIISLHIIKSATPKIHMMTEAGILGKIGLNSAGVGVTLNALQAKGVDYKRLPCHLALRTVLESTSRADAVQKISTYGVAAACHLTIADAQTGGIGLECTAFDVIPIPQNDKGMCTHSNHFIREHVKEGSKNFLPDSPLRLARIQQLLGESIGKPSMAGLKGFLKDEDNYPTAICRAPSEKSSLATLFSVVMDLNARAGEVKMGRPSQAGGEELILRPKGQGSFEVAEKNILRCIIVG